MPGPWPDAVGSALVVAGVGLLALGIVQGPEWGWGSASVLAAFAALLVAFVARCRTHPAPVVEPALLRVGSFAAATAGTLLVGIGFFAALLAGVLLLTEVWGYSALRAGRVPARCPQPRSPPRARPAARPAPA